MPCDRAPKYYSWRASVVFVCGGHVESVDNWSDRADSVPPGSESRANGQEGSPGTWEILTVSRRRPVQEQPVQQTPGRSADLASGVGRGQIADDPRYRQAKETERGETTVRKSQHFIVPMKQGNHPRDPVEGRECHFTNRWRDTCQVRRDLGSCQQNANGSRNSHGTALTWLSRI
jgi:hypothetical protein